ncbi:uncharacterized protein [Chelonus insularis]|uniref:uncharacterized protein n=1 Tax=Chelonus insularis TaxID=460826 RepID=UPI00158974F9|nr:uncharacterized protein LOC118069832 [Chelonus insularis]
MKIKSKIILLIPFVLISSTLTSEECYYDGDDFCVSQEDILSADLLPGTFFLSDPFKESNKKKARVKVNNNGTFEEALNKMDYHRKRMNEYLCHGFMAEEIFRDMRSIRVKRRHDESSSMNSMPDFLGDTNVTVHDKLLSDEGSSKYKEWLQRTTTLDDIYRHYKYNAAKSMAHKKMGPSSLEAIEEFDGEVTGYAIPAPLSHEKTEHYYESDEEASPTGYHYSHHPPPPPHHHHHPPPHHYPTHDEVIPVVHEEYHYHAPLPHEEEYEEHRPPPIHHKKNELSIKDFFEIALTALAFLAFGCFIIQLLMAMTYPPTASVATEIARHQRAATYRDVSEINELSHRVLQSIEAIIVAENDSGRCLEWVLCRDNQFSTQITSSQRIWIPMWSLGMSWLSSRMIQKDSWSAMFRSIKATVLGLGGANCAAIYSDCDLVSERAKRRRRRKK